MAERSWQHFYDTGFWHRRRKLLLTRHPLCKFCLDRGVVTVATVADHVERHNGDWNKFVLGKLQSLCADCHNSSKRLIEIRGYDKAVGDDGWPVDPRHPANKRG
jgi:5-methylcytosine-specific restriction enzyme A